jgi:DNA primase
MENDLVSVFSHYGRTLNPNRREQRTRCLLHDDQHPSMSVNVEKKVWHCPVCDAGGGVVKLVQLVEGVDYKKALDKTAEITGHEPTRSVSTRWLPPKMRKL